jgi:hypothetical protein
LVTPVRAYQPSDTPIWAFPIIEQVGKQAPGSDAEPVRTDPYSSGSLVTACHPIAQTSGNWVQLRPEDERRAAWFPADAVLRAPSPEICESMRVIYSEVIRNNANAVTGRSTVNIRMEPTPDSPIITALNVGEVATLLRIVPPADRSPHPWLHITLETGTEGFVRGDLVLFLREDTDCVEAQQTNGPLHYFLLDHDAEWPFPPDTLQAIAELLRDELPADDLIGGRRAIYFARNHSELLRVAPWAVRWESFGGRVIGALSSARWDGCNVQSQHTGVGELVATAVIDLSHGEMLARTATIHEISHFFGARHDGAMNTEIWEELLALALTDDCQSAESEYFQGLCEDLRAIDGIGAP